MIRSRLAWLRPEEALYGFFFFALFLVGLVRGEWTFALYADRFTYFFGILLVLFTTFRLHRRLAAMDTLRIGEVRDEFKGVLGVSRDLFNLYMCLAMYSSLAPLLNELPARDQWIIDFEHFLIGQNPLLLLEPFIRPSVTKIMVVFYLAFLLYPPILLMYLLISGKVGEMRQFTLALSIALFIGYSGYLLIPAVGPAVFLADDFTVSLWKNTPQTYADVLRAIDLNRTPKDCFPSMHACLSLLCLLHARRFSRGLFFLFLPGITGLLLSTLYLRYHYVSDVIAGTALAVFATHTGPIIRERWKAFTRPRPGPLTLPPADSPPNSS
jgi:membrane-associated phospholipid phosphatase